MLFSVESHFREVLSWELLQVVLAALFVTLTILFIIRRVAPKACWNSPMCLGGRVIKRARRR